MEILILPHQKLKPVTPLLRLQYPSLPLPIAGTRSLKWRNKARTCSISCTLEMPTEVGFERRAFFTFLVAGAALYNSDVAGAVSKRALRGAKIPETEYTTLPNGLKYYDLKVGNGPVAVKGSRVAIHYVAKWRNITFMTSRQGLGVGGGTPYGFDVGDSKRGTVLKGLDLGVEGMRVGGQRLLIVPPELAYGSKGVQEIPPNATIEFDVELLSIKRTPFGSPVKIVEG